MFIDTREISPLHMLWVDLLHKATRTVVSKDLFKITLGANQNLVDGWTRFFFGWVVTKKTTKYNVTLLN